MNRYLHKSLYSLIEGLFLGGTTPFLPNVLKAQQSLELWTSAQPVLSHIICCDNKDFLLLVAHTLPKGSLWAPSSPEPPHPELFYSPSFACSPHNLPLVRLPRYFILTGLPSCSPGSLLPRFPLPFWRALSKAVLTHAPAQPNNRML